METFKAYHSCFLVDVKIQRDFIILEDTGRNTYYVDRADQIASDSFKVWFKTVFMFGVAQTISIFEYETKPIEEGLSGMFIKKFLNLNQK